MIVVNFLNVLLTSRWVWNRWWGFTANNSCGLVFRFAVIMMPHQRSLFLFISLNIFVFVNQYQNWDFEKKRQQLLIGHPVKIIFVCLELPSRWSQTKVGWTQKTFRNTDVTSRTLKKPIKIMWIGSFQNSYYPLPKRTTDIQTRKKTVDNC